MKKELKIGASLDLSGFDQQVNQIQQKIRQLKSSMDTTASHSATSKRLEGLGLGGMSPQSKAEYERQTQKQKRDMDQLIREQVQANDKLKKAIDERKKAEESLNKMLDARVKGTKEYLELEQKIARQKENTFRMEQQYGTQNKILNDNLGGSRGLSGGGSGGGRGGSIAGLGGGIGGSIMSGLGMGSLTLSAIVSAITKYMVDLPGTSARISQSSGAATQGVIGNNLSNLSGGNIWDLTSNAPAHSSAMRKAQEADSWRNITDAVPGSGRSTEFWKMVMTQTPGSMDEYESARSGQLSQDYLSLVESEKQQDPMRQRHIEYQSQNYQRDLSLQRSLGLSDDGLYGAYGSAAAAGFRQDDFGRMSSGILSSGGSTRSALSNANLGMKAERGFGLNNASSILGKLSSTIGDSTTTENAFKRIMAASVSQGLDDSQFVEEQKRFVDLTASAIASSGATGQLDINNILSKMSTLTSGQNTQAGLQASGDVYQQMQALSRQGTGRNASLGLAAFMQDPDLAKLGFESGSNLMTLGDRATADHPAVIAAAQKAGITPEEVVEKIQKTDRRRLLASAGINDEQKQLGTFQKWMKQNPNSFQPTKEQLEDTANYPGLSDQYDLASKIPLRLTGETGTSQQSKSWMNYLGNRTSSLDGSMGKVDSTLESSTGRSGDQIVAAQAKSQQILLESFKGFKDEITPTVEKINILTVTMGAFAEAIGKANTEVEKIALRNRASEVIRTLSQPQSSKPKSSGGR